MTERRNGSLLLEDSSEDEDSTIDIVAADILEPPRYITPRRRPAPAHFNLDSLSAFLRRELKENDLKLQRLRDEPALAAAEAEKEELRKLVNSKRSIEASVRNGRLEVCTSNAVLQRCNSAPPTDGDNESARRRSRSSVGAGSRKAGFFHPAEKSHNRSGPYPPSRNMQGLERSSQTPLLPEYTNHHTPLTPARGPRSNDGQQPHDIVAPLTAQLDIQLNDAADGGDTNATTSGKTKKTRNAGFAITSGSHSFPPSIESSWSKEVALQNTTNWINLHQPSGGDQSRYLSFEKHTDNVRSMDRSSKEISNQTSFDGTKGLIAIELDSPRSRKVAGGRSGFAVDQVARNSGSTSLMSTTDLPGSSMDGFYGNPNNFLENRSAISNARGIHRNGDDRKILDTTFFHDFVSSNSRKEVDRSTIRRSSAVPVSSSFEKQASRRKSLAGKDTFYSNSSDDNLIDDEQDDGLENEAVQTEEEVKCINKNDEGIENSNQQQTAFDYSTIVPENLPLDILLARDNCHKIWSLTGLNEKGQPNTNASELWYTTQYTTDELNPEKSNILEAPNSLGQYPRKWKVCNLPTSSQDPPQCPAHFERDEFPPQILPEVCKYLSSQDVRNLRLVNRATASAILPLMIRSTVMNFSASMFDATDGTNWDDTSDIPAPSSVLHNYGSAINRFGISFDFDEIGLRDAENKDIEEEVDAWFGKYTWPKARYPHFLQLKEIEDLVESNRALLKNSMKSLTTVSELGLAVDSGHGWLNGLDVSDMALLRKSQAGGSKVFGQVFDAPNKWHEFAIREFFKWGQQNSINACLKRLAVAQKDPIFKKVDKKFLRRISVRDYDDYKVQSNQPDFNRYAHTGGIAPAPNPHPAALPGGAALAALTGNAPHAPAVAGPPPPAGLGNMPLPLNPAAQTAIGINPQVLAINAPGQQAAHNPQVFVPLAPRPPRLQRRLARSRIQRQQAAQDGSRNAPVIPQWPLLFNCHNIAAEVGGNYAFIQDEIPQPARSSYLPGELTETQVQWLMEILWAQRAFLSAYTNSIIANAGIFKNVHSLHIAKLSSGLISSLAQQEFWSALPNLRKLTLKVIPDWRQEHIPGDKLYFRNMAISPVQASKKLADLLETFVAKLENLSVLSTGFVGGGEHQTGIFGRNSHILPAPITREPYIWLMGHVREPTRDTMFTFSHIRDLTFENCWFSPLMLQTFMRRSRDTSLHHLTLDSVSLTGIHDVRLDGPLTTEQHNLKCEFSPSEWLHETIPRSACWVDVLDKVTPGRTILDRKYDAQMIDEETNPRPEPGFKGHVRKISLNSCGYVRISGVREQQFSQHGLVEQNKSWDAMDDGLETRKQQFYVAHQLDSPTLQGSGRRRNGPPRAAIFIDPSNEAPNPRSGVMMSTRDPVSREEYFGLGKLTQCVHPIEKRILERAWGMRFGWGDTMERWGAVEDGWFEGGTGRFSGIIERDDEN